MNPYAIGTADLTEAMPKICIPLMGEDCAALRQACEALAGAPYDLVEWRVDTLRDLSERDEALAALRSILAKASLLMTFRTVREGGQHPLSDEAYLALLRWMADTGEADGIDVEYSAPYRKEAAAYIQGRGIPIVMSAHDFDKTPPVDDMTAHLEAMQEGDAIAKLAVMAHTMDDVLALLAATARVRARRPERPIITMAMGQLGIISRAAGEFFGSALTFGTAGASSAPGQMEAGELKTVLTAFHQTRTQEVRS